LPKSIYFLYFTLTLGLEIGNGPKDEIPRNCQFPSEVQHVVQLVNMKTLGQTDLKGGPANSDTGQFQVQILHLSMRFPFLA